MPEAIFLVDINWHFRKSLLRSHLYPYCLLCLPGEAHAVNYYVSSIFCQSLPFLYFSCISLVLFLCAAQRSYPMFSSSPFRTVDRLSLHGLRVSLHHSFSFHVLLHFSIFLFFRSRLVSSLFHGVPYSTLIFVFYGCYATGLTFPTSLSSPRIAG